MFVDRYFTVYLCNYNKKHPGGPDKGKQVLFVGWVLLGFPFENMKKHFLKIACVGLVVCMLNASCIGSFSLFNKFAEWNLGLTGNKFFNCLIGFVLTPVYGICLTVDWIALNTIEFWTGSPLLASVGETKHVVGSDGNQYVIVTEKDGYHIQNETTGEDMRMVFSEEDKTWSMVQNEASQKMFRLNDDNTVTVYLPDGSEATVTKDQNGLDDLKAMVSMPVPFMVSK